MADFSNQRPVAAWEGGGLAGASPSSAEARPLPTEFLSWLAFMGVLLTRLCCVPERPSALIISVTVSAPMLECLSLFWRVSAACVDLHIVYFLMRPNSP